MDLTRALPVVAEPRNSLRTRGQADDFLHIGQPALHAQMVEAGSRYKVEVMAVLGSRIGVFLLLFIQEPQPAIGVGIGGIRLHDGKVEFLRLCLVFPQGRLPLGLLQKLLLLFLFCAAEEVLAIFALPVPGLLVFSHGRELGPQGAIPVGEKDLISGYIGISNGQAVGSPDR